MLAASLALLVLLVGIGATAAQAQTTGSSPGATTGAIAPPASEPSVAAQAVRGTLREDGEPLEGVRLSAEQGGVVVGETTSAPDGTWRIDLPAAGPTVVTLDTGSLPDGVEVRQETREVTVRPGALQPAAFLFGQADSSSASKLDRTPQLLFNGLLYGLVLALAALGLSLVFGTTGLTNFAHGELITLGALFGYYFNVTIGMNLIPAACITVVVVGALGGVLDRLLWRPLRRRGTGLIAALIISIGLGLALKNAFLFQFGGGSRSYSQYSTQDPYELDALKLSVLPRDLVIIGVCVLVLVAVATGLQKTRVGKATRAISDNPALAASSGIDVDSVINKVWIVGTGLAALGGVFLALSQQVGFELGSNALLLLFAGVTLGGLGTAYGALLGSLIIGLVTQLSTLFISAELQVVAALAILILVLVVRPQGILGRAERVG